MKVVKVILAVIGGLVGIIVFAGIIASCSGSKDTDNAPIAPEETAISPVAGPPPPVEEPAPAPPPPPPVVEVPPPPPPPPVVEPAPAPPPPPPVVATDPNMGTCKDARAAGYGPYTKGQPEYEFYRDSDGDGTVCEK